MTDDWCEVMEMFKASCVHCRPPAERRRLEQLADDMAVYGAGIKPRTDVAPEAPWADGAAVPAKYAGRCSRCNEPFDVGEPIRLSDGHLWIHRECP